MMTLNEICYNPATSTFLSVVFLASKSSHTQNMLLCIESAGRYTRQWQIREFQNGGAEKGRGFGGCLEAPSGSRAEPWWGSRGETPEAGEFLHVKGVFSSI
jgi:hypothetical protein